MDDHTKKVDLLHPLVVSSVKLEIHLPIEMKDSQAVLFKEKLYVGGGTTETQTDSAMLYIYSPDSRAWDSMNTPVSHFALAVYQSQIVLVGGKECCCENISQITNKVWVMTEQINHWKTDIIPHMKLHRSGAVAVSIDSVLIVTGGEHELSALYIEIYDGNDMWWNIKRPSDLGVSDVKMAFHEGNCYLMGGLHGRSVFSANLGTLVSSSKAGGDHEEDLSLWRQIPDIPEQVAWGCPAIFGSRLVVQNGGILYAFCPSTQVWVLVPLKMKMPNENIYSACVIGSNRELIVIGGVSAETKLVSKEIIQVSINYPVYNPNEKFSLESLYLFQSVAGIPLLHELKKRRSDLLRIIRVKQTSTLEDALKRWITDGVPSRIEPTWKSIRLLLRLLHLDELECRIGRVLENSENLSTQCNYVENNIQLSDHGINAAHVSNSDCEIEYQYSARIFFIHQRIATYEIHFIIPRDISDHVSVINKEFEEKGAHSGPYQLIRFEENAISLDVSKFNSEMNGWELTPQSPPIITKQQVDTFEPGKTLPGCQLLAQLLHQTKDISDVQCRIHLCGAKSPHNYFIINLPITDREYNMKLPRKRQLSRSEIEQSSAKRSCLDELTQTPQIAADTPSLKDLMTEFYTNANFDMWENIGIMLGINDGKLNRIKTDYAGDSKSCLREMLREWLKIIEPPPSWRAIVDALEVLGSDQGFVQTLKSKYC